MKNPLLEEDNDWRMIASVLTDVLDAQFGVTVLPSSSGGRLKAVIENLSAGQYRLVIPIGQQDGKPVVAVGTLQADPGEILEKLLGVAVRCIHQDRRLEEQRRDLDVYAEQISRDFEELNWLRGLLRHLKDRDGAPSSEGGESSAPPNGAAEDLVKAVLLPLCPLIGAEEILLLSADRESGSPGEDVPRVGNVVLRVGPGKRIADDQSCCKLADRLREIAGTQPLVQTGMKRRREFSMVPEVGSCILVPMARQGSILGWLLAVNQAARTGDSETATDTAATQPSELDFGTGEANLLDFAAVVLAAHDHCLELVAEPAAGDRECLTSS